MKIARWMSFGLILIAGSFSSYGATVSITADYRESANIFVIMDCVSGWWGKSFCQDDGAYQKDWESRFGLSPKDLEFFSKYDAIRQQYYKGLGAPTDKAGPYSDGIFAKKSAITEDLIAPAFYSSKTLTEALSKLQRVVNERDMRFLKEFYEFFRPKY